MPQNRRGLRHGQSAVQSWRTAPRPPSDPRKGMSRRPLEARRKQGIVRLASASRSPLEAEQKRGKVKKVKTPYARAREEMAELAEPSNSERTKRTPATGKEKTR